jgi:hypothetical protein
MKTHPFTGPDYPFHHLINPFQAFMVERTNHWIDNEYQIFSAPAREKYKQMNIGTLSAVCFPRVTNYLHMQPLIRWILWGIMLDDYYEPCTSAELQIIQQELLAVLEGAQPEAGHNGIYHQAAAMRDELRAIMPDHWMKRFIRDQNTQFEGMIMEAPYKLGKRFPTLKTFMYIRELSVAIYPMLHLLQVQDGKALPEDIVAHPILQRLGTLSTRMTAWLNDFYTLPKELLRDNDTINLVLVLRHEHKISLEEAYAEAMDIHTKDLHEFLSLQKQLPDFDMYNEVVSNYVRDMGLFLQGQKTWYEHHTSRYLPEGYVSSEYKRRPG